MNRRALVAGGVLLTLAFGCAEIYGLGDYSAQDGGVDSGGNDVAFIDGYVYDAWTDGSSGCPGACVPPIPGGWTAIAYDQAFRPSCATYYGTATDIAEGVTAAPATCGCSCSLTAPGCNSLLVTAGDGGTCNNQSSQSFTWDGGCVSLSSINAQNEKMSVTASGPGTCAPDASVVKPSVSYTYQGRMCQLLAAPSSGCEAGVCVPDPAPYVSCVYQAGAVACPSGYPVQHDVGTSVNDARGCTQCTCGYDGGACGGSATLYTGTACNAQTQALTADGTCQTVASQTFKSLAYQPSTTTGACTPSPVSPTGDAGFADPQTVCCTK